MRFCPIPSRRRLDIPEAPRGAVNIDTPGACPWHMLRLRQQPQHRIFNCQACPEIRQIAPANLSKKKKKKRNGIQMWQPTYVERRK